MELKDNGYQIACEVLPKRFSEILRRFSKSFSDVTQEIILRRERPAVIESIKGRYFFTQNSGLSAYADSSEVLCVSSQELKDTFMKICSYSVHSFQSEINAGFVTMKGGLRVGLCGEAALSDLKIVSIKHITTLNFRIAREHNGCSKEILDRVNPLEGVLLCGAPSSGKTSILRDMARTLSYSYKISMIDERNELSATVEGKQRNNIGLCDVYVGYPKSEAILQAIRSQSPDIIAVDEIGDERELEAVRYALFCGASFIATAHGDSLNRPMIRALLGTHAFSSTVMLLGRKQPGQVREILCSG